LVTFPLQGSEIIEDNNTRLARRCNNGCNDITIGRTEQRFWSIVFFYYVDISIIEKIGFFQNQSMVQRPV